MGYNRCFFLTQLQEKNHPTGFIFLFILFIIIQSRSLRELLSPRIVCNFAIYNNHLWETLSSYKHLTKFLIYCLGKNNSKITHKYNPLVHFIFFMGIFRIGRPSNSFCLYHRELQEPFFLILLWFLVQFIYYPPDTPGIFLFDLWEKS